MRAKLFLVNIAGVMGILAYHRVGIEMSVMLTFLVAVGLDDAFTQALRDQRRDGALLALRKFSQDLTPPEDGPRTPATDQASEDPAQAR